MTILIKLNKKRCQLLSPKQIGVFSPQGPCNPSQRAILVRRETIRNNTVE